MLLWLRPDPPVTLVLQEFLKKEFSEENILFWQACEFFSHVPENDKKQVARFVILARAFHKNKEMKDRFSSLIFPFMAFFPPPTLPPALSTRQRDLQQLPVQQSHHAGQH